MRTALVALALSSAALLAAASPAGANATGTDDLLRSELEARRSALSEATDKDGKKQYKAVLKSLKFMDKSVKDLAGDIKTAGKVAKTLGKAFPGEFQPSIVVSLRDHCSTLFGDLQGLVGEGIGTLHGVVGGLSTKGQAKVNLGLETADALLDTVDTADFAAWAKSLFAAQKLVLKAQKVVDKDKGPTVGLSIQVDGKAFNPDKETVAVVLNEIAGLLVFSASKTGLPAYNLSVTPGLVLGTGSPGVATASWNVLQLPPKNYMASTGTFNVTALDNEANTISFSFSVTLHGVAGTTGDVTIEGSYTGPFTSGSDPE